MTAYGTHANTAPLPWGPSLEPYLLLTPPFFAGEAGVLPSSAGVDEACGVLSSAQIVTQEFAGPRAETEDGFESHIGTNHLGHFLLIHLLLPVLRSSACPRFSNAAFIALNTTACVNLEFIPCLVPLTLSVDTCCLQELSEFDGSQEWHASIQVCLHILNNPTLC